MKPLVSAIITSFNRKQFLKKSCVSVLNQTFKNFELIVLDNSSSDGSLDYLRSLKDSRLRIISHKPMSISSQRNLGIKKSTGDFIAFLDDDDVWKKNKLELQIKKIQEKQNCALVYGGFEFYNDDGSRWGQHIPQNLNNFFEEILYTKDPFCGSASNPMIRKSILLQTSGYDENVEVGEDWELYIRLSKSYIIETIPDVILSIRQHSGARLGDRLESSIKTDLIVLNKHLKDMNSLLIRHFQNKIAFKLIRLGQKKQSLKYIFMSKPNFNTIILIIFLGLPIKSILLANNLRKSLNHGLFDKIFIKFSKKYH